MMKKKGYKAGGKMPKKKMGGAPMNSPRPKMRPSRAPMNSPRPKMRPRGMDATPEEIAALERGNRMQMMEGRENEEIRKGEAAMKKASPMGMKAGGMAKKGYKKGGKIRGYGLARGGKVCKMR